MISLQLARQKDAKEREIMTTRRNFIRQPFAATVGTTVFAPAGKCQTRDKAMIKVSVMYPNTPGARFNHEYYRDKHMPLVKARMGDACKSYTVDKGLAGGAGAPATYVGSVTSSATRSTHSRLVLGLMPKRSWQTSQTIPISLRSSKSVKSS